MSFSYEWILTLVILIFVVAYIGAKVEEIIIDRAVSREAFPSMVHCIWSHFVQVMAVANTEAELPEGPPDGIWQPGCYPPHAWLPWGSALLLAKTLMRRASGDAQNRKNQVFEQLERVLAAAPLKTEYFRCEYDASPYWGEPGGETYMKVGFPDPDYVAQIARDVKNGGHLPERSPSAQP